MIRSGDKLIIGRSIPDRTDKIVDIVLPIETANIGISRIHCTIVLLPNCDLLVVDLASINPISLKPSFSREG